MRRIHLPVAAGIAALALVLAGCGGGTDDQGQSGTPAQSAPSTSASAAAASSSAPATAGGGSTKKITVNQTIDDPVMGDHVVVTTVVRDFPFPAGMDAVSDGELVLVQLTATAGQKYYAGWQTSGLQLLTADGDHGDESDTDSLDAAMTKAGYPPVPDGGDVDTGKTATGWVPFVESQKDSPTLTLRMQRLAATTSDGGTITAQNFDVPLVK